MSAPRRTVALPDSGMFKRAGKIRLGVRVPSSNSERLFPKATDHFVVREDESGITSPEAAAAFHAVCGDEPRSINVLLPGHTPEEVFEGAHRLYGTGKLKRRCDGETCDVRRATGGWDEKPCACKAEGIPPVVLNKGQQQRNPKHCTLSWTLQVILAEVAGIGVWTLTTTSEIAANDIANALRLAHTMTGSLALLKATLWLRQVEVAPDGQTKKVWVPSLRFDDVSPMQLMAGGGRVPLAPGPRPQLPTLEPPPDEFDDDAPDAEQEPTDVDIRPAPAPTPETPLRDAVKAQLQGGLSKEHGAYVLANYGSTIGAAADKIIELHGEDARHLAPMLDTLIGESVNDEDIEVVA